MMVQYYFFACSQGLFLIPKEGVVLKDSFSADTGTDGGKRTTPLFPAEEVLLQLSPSEGHMGLAECVCQTVAATVAIPRHPPAFKATTTPSARFGNNEKHHQKKGQDRIDASR
jgi:hypothetical protein